MYCLLVFDPYNDDYYSMSWFDTVEDAEEEFNKMHTIQQDAMYIFKLIKSTE